MTELEKLRVGIAAAVRRLRADSRWTQVALAERLRISQSRLSEIERGAGSFTAEQLVAMLRIFNVGISDLIAHDKPEAELERALARLGARHLYQNENIVPSERLEDVRSVTYEAMLVATPRLLTSLGPVLVEHLDRVNLGKLERRLGEAGLDRRLGWLIENLRAAIDLDVRVPLSRATVIEYRRAGLVWDGFLELARTRLQKLDAVSPDLLPATSRSMRAAASPISQRWGVITSLQPQDFADALEAARSGTAQ